MHNLLPRKIDKFLESWKSNKDKKPLIVKGARQIGKTESIRHFAEKNYKNVIEINFVLQPEFNDIFANGFEVDTIIRNISLHNPEWRYIPGETLFFFDELQKCPSCATSLKSFKVDGRFDVICSRSLMGIYYKEIESNSVGYKQDYFMYSMDFEEFLWAKGYARNQIDSLLENMVEVKPFNSTQMNVFKDLFMEYMIVGGMPALVDLFVYNKNFSGILNMQRELLLDYEEDITKYASGMDQARILNVYRRIPVFLAQSNKKYQISKIKKGARNREYASAIDWLSNAGIVNVCYRMENPELPLSGNYNPSDYKIYYADTGLLLGSLDDESQKDLRDNKNFNTYKGAIFENVIAESILKQAYPVYYYRNETSTVEMDFMLRDANSIVPIEVKATNGATKSLNTMTNPAKKHDKYSDIKYGIKLCSQNVGFNGYFYTFPYFTAFLLRRFLNNKSK